MYKVPQLSALPASSFFACSRSPRTPVAALGSPFCAGLRETAGRMCRRRPWNELRSSALYAASAPSGEVYETYASPLAERVMASRGMWICKLSKVRFRCRTRPV